MSQVRVAAFTVSADGFGAGPDQSLDSPLGRGGEGLHAWLTPTRAFRRMSGQGDDGEGGLDEDFAARSFADFGAWIIGRNMFGPVRGPWPDDAWKGWWGPAPPFHKPVFVLTHHPRPPLEMEGGTVFHFVNAGIEAALAMARQAAGDQDVRIGGGVATILAYLRAGLIDELHVAVSPVRLGAGEAFMSEIDWPALGYQVGEPVQSDRATHLTIRR